MEERFVYNGWNLVAILNGSDVLQKHYTWGLDISGSEQGAGGVGGLLAVYDTSSSYFAYYDGNGNVTAYTDGASSAVASYFYSPFGAMTEKSGLKKDDFNFKFSTKFFDNLSNLYYYGFRYYSPRFARWINRDPIGEQGGINLYGMVGNDAVNKWDYLGKYYWMKSFTPSSENFIRRYSVKAKIAFYPQKEDGFCCEEIKFHQKARIVGTKLIHNEKAYIRKNNNGKSLDKKDVLDSKGKIQTPDIMDIKIKYWKGQNVASEMDEDGWFDDTTTKDSIYYQDNKNAAGEQQVGHAIPPNDYKPAKLTDSPSTGVLNKEDEKFIYRFSFTTTAVCTKGKDKGKNMIPYHGDLRLDRVKE